jgi:hypothetical protein
VRGDQAKRIAKAHTQRRVREMSTVKRRKKIKLSLHPQEIHHSSTGFPQLDLSQAAHYA